MKDYLLELVRGSPAPLGARNQVREYLQARILGMLQRAGAMIPLAFHGGTAFPITNPQSPIRTTRKGSAPRAPRGRQPFGMFRPAVTRSYLLTQRARRLR